ncbi:hypothetical protein EG328_007866 [Venturia inaequalis]|nr:hypothetical protein EG328_007866 [Venturia inaequalis]RDI89719.1 hypothetical protein Vi05172_g585 [Venturia inaequalis]
MASLGLHSSNKLQPFHCIGSGNCGSVWSIENPGINTSVIKREDMNEARSVYNDFIMHRKILSAIQELRLSPETVSLTSRVSMPACHQYVRADESTWWSTRLGRFPKECQAPCNVIVTERIPPFSQTARECLINRFCAPGGRETAKTSASNRDCIVRAYLGRRKLNDRPKRFFKLPNFPMNIDQMKQLDLDVEHYATAMAEMLAIMHWKAQMDANDVEFVLAPPRLTHEVSTQASPSSTIKSIHLGDHNLWILDFDCCGDMTMDTNGVDQAWRAFYKNDPYYPRPSTANRVKSVEDQQLWDIFKARFLEASEIILGPESNIGHLPGLLISKIESGNPHIIQKLNAGTTD